MGQGMKHDLIVTANYENDIKRLSKITVRTKITEEYFDDFEDTSKIGDWIVLNGGDSRTWRTQTNLTSGETIEGAWHILYDDTTTHDDYLISPIIEVKNGLTDGISFNAKNESMTYMEDVDLYVIDENYENIIGTLQENLTPPEEYLNYKFDLSEYEGQNIRIGFHSTTLDQYIFYMDDFKVGNYNTLSLNKIINDEIIIYPNPVNSILKIDGTFTDNFSNYGNFNALVNLEIENSELKQHFFSTELTYQDGSIFYGQGSRTSKEFEQGTGKLLITTANKKVKKCIRKK